MSPIGSTSSTSTESQVAAASSANLANEQTFLKLMVAQMQNQDPLKPVDSTQFVTQLAQFSSLEQLVGIRQDADKVAAPSATSPIAATTPTVTPPTTTTTTTDPTTTTPATTTPAV